MSGLRETIRRRGGLELTSRVAGGLWVVGKRTKTSPYNAAATAALMAAFPGQWPTIRDYGWQHEEIVGYMNAYAPEDAKIAYSLVPTLGVIRLVVNGTSGQYFDTGIVPSSTKYEVSAQFKLTSGSLFGNQYYDLLLYENSFYYPGGNRNTPKTVKDGNLHTLSAVYENSGINVDIDNGSTASWNYTIAPNKTVKIFGNDLGNRVADFGLGSIGYLKMNEAGWFVPFIRENNVELLNMVTGTLAERHGSFTISETPAS